MPKPIRLLYIYPTAHVPWYFQDGQNSYLTERGFELHLICSPGPLLDQVSRRDAITVHPLEIRRNVSPANAVTAWFRLVKAIRAIKPDIVHAGTPKGALLGMTAAWFAGVKARFFAAHGTISYRHRGFARRAFILCEKITAMLAKQMWCVSPSLLEYFRSVGIASSHKGVVLGNGSANGIRREWLFPAQSGISEKLAALREEKRRDRLFYLGFLGRIGKPKGIEPLALAWRSLREKHPSLRLLLIGDWDEIHPIDPGLQAELRDDPRVVFPGYVEHHETGPWLETLDVLAMPTVSEGFGNVLIETGLCGKPVVATDVIGCRDAVVDGKTGTLVELGNVDALIAAISKYVDDPSLAAAHGEAGRERASRDFTPEIIWEGLFREYTRLVEGRR